MIPNVKFMRIGVIKTDKKKIFDFLTKPFENGRLKWIILAFMALLGVLLMSIPEKKEVMETSVSPLELSSEALIEDKIKNICEKVRGAGETSVAVTLGGREKGTVSVGSFASGDEYYSEICGIGIVCEGGDDPKVVRELLELVSATCGVSTNRIYIAVSEKSGYVQS